MRRSGATTLQHGYKLFSGWKLAYEAIQDKKASNGWVENGTCKVKYDGKKITIRLSEICSSKTWWDLKAFLSGVGDVLACEIDFSRTQFIDNRGLSSLLALRKNLGKEVPISLVNTSKQIQEALSTANFGRQFQIV